MKQKRGILYWLRVILAAASVIFLCYRCSEGWGIPVYADGPSSHPDSTHVVTLTPAQTVALYGTQIQGILYATKNSSPITINFDYAFPLSSIGYMDSGGGFDEAATSSNIRSFLSNKAEIASYIGGCDGVVYVASSSQWGSVDTVPYGYTANSSVQLHCPFSIDLQGITGIKQALFYSAPSSLLASEWFSYSACTMTWLATPNNYTLYSVPSNASRSSVYRPTFIPLPNYPYYSSDSLDETALQYFTAFYNSYELEDAFDIRGFTVDAYAVQNASSGTDLWIILSCPTLYSYNPPTTTPAVTTRPPATVVPATYPVATMPTDVTNYPAIVINDNSVTQVNQLNFIIGQLNLIYAQLVANGKLSVDLGFNPDLKDGDSISIYGTDIKHQMETIINGHTTAALPNFNNEYVSSGFGFLMDQPWIAMLGGLGLALSVACWVIFEGRH